MKTIFNLKSIIPPTALASALLYTANLATAESTVLEEVVVTSQFREVSVLNLANSVSVFGQDDIIARGADNLDQLLNMAPNVNFSAGASRGRFIQIRGVGERSQFIDPVNPSVGLIIDGIDFSGLGLAASTLDVDQVEVLRGPQGTLYGANALAGLVHIRSNDPTDSFTANVSAEVAEYDTQSLSFTVSGPISERLKYRLAAKNQQSDGYINNRYLNRDDTNNIDESIVRGKLRFDATDKLQLDFSALYINVDNGYDAFSFYNTRDTLSDEPGRDRQETVAGSISALWSANKVFTIEAIISAADSETEYGYDEDWSYKGFFLGVPEEYSSTDNYLRNRDNISADLRFISSEEGKIFGGKTSWITGLYTRYEDENLTRNKSFKSRFETENTALYGELRSAVKENFDLVVGLRFENRDADYSDNTDVNLDKDENFWGGHITLEYQLDENTLLYGLVSRGYKAGGVNGAIISAAETNPAISSDVFEFDTETMLNYELGLKGSWLESRLQAQLAVFYQDREDVQAKQSIFDPADFSFDDFLANAAGGKTTGLEMEVNYLPAETIRLFANVGLLNAEFDDFVSSSHVDAKTLSMPVNLDGREVAHAPKYQFFIGSEIALSSQLTLRLEVEGKDEFYFSNSHDEKSTSYELFNARLTYHQSNWEVALWGRNLANEDYYTRGFYFSNEYGNNPANGYAPEAYYQLAAPRVFGLSGSYSF
jgi:outer membrane receptor protein involved in Fe transport